MGTPVHEVGRALTHLCHEKCIQFAVEDVDSAMETIELNRPDREPLTANERSILAGLRAPKRRAEWLAGRRAAKRVVCGLLLEDDVRSVEVGRDGAGAPAVTGHADIAVSISHSCGVAVAVGARFPVGIDVEFDEPRPECLWNAVLSHAELCVLAEHRGQDGHSEGNRLWTSKEAVSKVGGWGSTKNFKTIDCVGDPVHIDGRVIYHGSSRAAGYIITLAHERSIGVRHG